MYLRTLAPGLTWLHYGSDGGDLIAAAAGGGVAHPTGYPLYLLLARLFLLLPFGPPAYRTNLMSAVFGVLASLVIYRIVVQHLAAAGHRKAVATLAGLAAGYAFGLSPLAWSQAVITEVYALQGCLLAWIIYLYSAPLPASPSEKKTLDRWRGLALGLALANHMTSLLLVPLALLLGSARRAAGEVGTGQGRLPWLRQVRFDLPSLGRQLLWLAAGTSLYLVLPLRARMVPPVNWGAVTSPGRLVWLVSGRLYQDLYVPPGIAHLWQQAQAWLDFGIAQFGMVALVLALLGLVLYLDPSRLMALTLWTALTSLAFVWTYRPADAEVYLLPLLVSISIWIGIGTGGLSRHFLQRVPVLGWGVPILILGLALVRPVGYFQRVDASRDRAAESFAAEALAAAPEHAILFTEGDRALFALWYYHFTLHRRPDLALVAEELLPYEWYQETLRSTYPSLLVAGPLVYPETIARENRSRPVCTVRYSDRMEMSCTPGADLK